MKILNYLVIIFICINPSVKADSKKTLINELQKGGKLIFIRHAYALVVEIQIISILMIVQLKEI